MAHVYKDLLIAMAEGKEIQGKYLNPEFSRHWFDVRGNSTAIEQLVKGVTTPDYEIEFRIKPRTHIVNGHEINAPEVKMPNNGDVYYFPMGKGFIDDSYVGSNEPDSLDLMYLNAGLMYLTEEDAQAHSNAWMNPKM